MLKSRKSYKIEIPESGMFNQTAGQLSLNRMITIDRAEIHIQVQTKAFKLGYHWSGDKSKCSIKHFNLPYLYLRSTGIILTSDDREMFETSDHERIEWFEFKQLPDDSVSSDIDDLIRRLRICSEIRYPERIWTRSFFDDLCFLLNDKHEDLVALVTRIEKEIKIKS